MRRVLDETTAKKLRWVKGAHKGMDVSRFPDFLIVGPQRTGTTWLHAHLRDHPRIFLSEPKELFFFSRLKTPDHPKFESSDLGWYLRRFRDPLWRRLVKTGGALWRYQQPYWPEVRGEATASYAAMDEDVIEEITALNPDIRIILMVRNPVDRAWSHAKKDLLRRSKREVSEVPEQEFKAFFTDEYQLRCSRYVENCDNWTDHLKPGHLLLCFFEDIALRPRELLIKVMAFLGVAATERFIADDVHESINPSGPSRIPATYRLFLEELLRPEMELFAKRFKLEWPLGRHPLYMELPEG